MTIQADNPAREPAPVGAPEGQPSEPVRTEEDALLDELRGPEEEPSDDGEPQTPAEIISKPSMLISKAFLWIDSRRVNPVTSSNA